MIEYNETQKNELRKMQAVLSKINNKQKVAFNSSVYGKFGFVYYNMPKKEYFLTSKGEKYMGAKLFS